jgi:hypothetical protein
LQDQCTERWRRRYVQCWMAFRWIAEEYKTI